jgi:hypothetical protein
MRLYCTHIVPRGDIQIQVIVVRHTKRDDARVFYSLSHYRAHLSPLLHKGVAGVRLFFMPKKGKTMPERTHGRVALTITLDRDAVEILRILTPSKKGLGYVLSELVRREVVRREERKKVVEELRQERRDAERLAVAERRA